MLKSNLILWLFLQEKELIEDLDDLAFDSCIFANKINYKINMEDLDEKDPLGSSASTKTSNLTPEHIELTEDLLKEISLLEQSSENVKTSLISKYLEIAEHLYKSKDLKSSMSFYDRALGLLEGLEPLNLETLASIHEKLGLLNSLIGSSGKSIGHYKRTIEIKSKLLDEKHFDLSHLFYLIGDVHFSNLSIDEALSNYQKALEIALTKFSDQDPEISNLHFRIGQAQFSKGLLDEAVDSCLKALRIRVRRFGDGHLSLSEIYEALGRIHSAKGQVIEAVKNVNLSIEIKRKKYGSGHITVAESQLILGQIYHAHGMNEETNQIFQKSMEIMDGCSESNSRGVLDLYLLVGNLSYACKFYSNAVDCYEKYLASKKKILGGVDVSLAHTMRLLAITYYHQEDYDKALSYHHMALDLYKKEVKEENGVIIGIYHDIGLTLIKKKEYKLGMEYIQKANRIQLKNFSPKDWLVQECCSILANGVRNVFNYEQAYDFDRKTLLVQNKIVGPNHQYARQSKVRTAYMEQELAKKCIGNDFN